MGTIKIIGFDEDGNAQRLKIRIARILDYDPVTGADKENIRDSLGVSPDATGLVRDDIGSGAGEIPVNGMLGDLAYQSSEAVSVAELEVESTTGTATTQALTVTDGTDTNFVVQEDGKTGIGGSPSSALHVFSSTADNLRLERTGVADFRLQLTSGALAFRDATADAERLRLDSSGRFGIGTASPDSTLEVTGASATSNNGATVLVTDNASVAADIGGTIALRGTDGSSDRTLALIKGGKKDGTSAFDGYLSLQTRTNGNANTTERVRITNSALVLGSGVGIDFGAVASGTGTVVPATGGTLDDFERGSFTPSFTSTGTAPTLTYLAQVGTYTKVGNLVTCHGRVRVNAVAGAGTGSLQISGLPFATQNVSNLQSGGAVCLAAFFGTTSSGCPTHLSGANNATVMTLKTLKNSAGVVASLDNTDAADLAGNCLLDFSITYTTS